MSKCPNKSDAAYKKLIDYLGENNAMKAWLSFNQGKSEDVEWDIPELNHLIVEDLRKIKLNYGYSKDEGLTHLDSNGNELEHYTDNKGNIYKRLTNIVRAFSNFKQDLTKDYQTAKADKIWTRKDKTPIPHETKLSADITGNEWGRAETYQECLDRLKSQQAYAQTKGNIVHTREEILINGANESLKQQLLEKIDRYVIEFNKITHGIKLGTNAFDWINKESMKKIYANMNINILDDNINTAMVRDKVMTEVTFVNKELGIATTTDLIAQKQYTENDNKIIVVDWKTGSKFDSQLGNTLMKWGETKGLNITENSMNRAKLEIMMRNILIKSVNPDFKWEASYVGWIPNEYKASEFNPDSEVNVETFLPMIESFFKSVSSLQEAGLPTNSYEILKKTKGIFDPKTYSNKISESLAAELINSPTTITPQQRLDSKIGNLNLLVSQSKDFFHDKNITSEQKEEAKKLMLDIQDMTKGNQLLDSSNMDLATFRGLLGNYTDMNNPRFILWSRWRKKAEFIYQNTVNAKVRKFTSMLQPIIDDYKREFGKITVGDSLRNFDYNDIYGNLFKKIDNGQSTTERLVTENDKEWEGLGRNRQNFLKFLHKEFASYLKDDSFLTKKTLEDFGTKVSILDKQGFKYEEGFFPKTPKTEGEYFMELVKNSNGLGAVENLKKFSVDLGRKALSFFHSNNYEAYESDVVMPVKYLGNKRINAVDGGVNYSHNLETSYRLFIENMEAKKHLQPVYTAGKALVFYFETMQYNNEFIFKGLAKWLDTHLTKDVLHERLKDNYLTKPKEFSLWGKKVEIVPDKVIELAMGYVGSTTMWLQPIKGIGNATQANFLIIQEILKGQIGEKLLGLKGTSTDLTWKGMAIAFKEWGQFKKDSALGNITKNKTFLLLQKFNYFEKYKKLLMEEGLLSTTNPALKSENLAFMHEVFENQVAITTMINQLASMKIDVNGVEKSVLECYEVIDDPNAEGQKMLKWTGGVRGYIRNGITIEGKTTHIEEELTELDSNEILKLKKVQERLQGGYGSDQTLNIEVTEMGKAFTMFKKYLPRILLNAFSSKREEWSLGYYKKIGEENGKDILEWEARVVEGKWLTLGHSILTILRVSNNENYKWDNLSDEQKQSVIEASVKLLFLVGMYAAYVKMFGDDDEDDTYKKFWKRYLVDNLSEQYNLIDLMKSTSTAANPVIAAKIYKLAKDISTFMVAGAQYTVGDEEDALNREGDIKGWNNIVKGTPGIGWAKTLMNQLNKGGSLGTDEYFSNDHLLGRN